MSSSSQCPAPNLPPSTSPPTKQKHRALTDIKTVHCATLASLMQCTWSRATVAPLGTGPRTFGQLKSKESNRSRGFDLFCLPPFAKQFRYLEKHHYLPSVPLKIFVAISVTLLLT
ncbi:hypothetical protein QC762_0092630 [Podospora pseudocomata]|uniref:Uncharacterized protein n=1 Tax=Podospora pseudocomata TaxID=2093779 RepID=A0ABR0G6Q7_9PEZI|nr:hypothetical protein QC762_0092630 [Podospora pseudocomata]